MRGSFRNTLSIGFVTTMLLLSACSGGGAGVGEPGAPGPGESSKGGTPAASGPADKSKRVTIKIMANFSEANITPADKALFDKLKAALNVDLEWVVPPSTGYKEQLQLSLVSGDYADLVMFPSETDETFLNAVKEGIVIPVNPYLDQLKNIKQHTYDISWEALETNRDGKIYGVPRTSVARNDGFIIREDWLKNIGFKMPENREVTIDQFTEILRKFTFEDPDKNGKNDTYGFAGYLNGSKMIDPILSSQFGNLGWQKSTGGEFEYMTPMYDKNNTKIYKDVLAYTQMAFKEGLVDPDSPVIERSASIERFERGISGIRYEFSGNMTGSETRGKKINPNTDIEYIFIQDREGKLKGAAYGTATFGVWGVTNKAKEPQRALEVLDWLLSDEGWNMVKYGVEGVEYNMVNGERQYNPDAKAPWRKNIVRRANDGDFFIPTNLPEKERQQIKRWVDRSIETVVFSLDKGYIPPAAKKPEYMDFKLIWDETITKIMIGELPVDEFDKLLAQWYKKGGEEYVKQMNEYIKSTQK
ncbi:putative aldouronate transport system substrate-binding protein [Paenibacillus sp. UNCCL117]|uniref:extracellular solute-binding protein n=1 Tax=unclassified Paenibacillus TaxID=185978 RepID=UPI0008847FBB|nr:MULTISPECIES: extracellular solute-binding protein [unclassified Paenibacillus]SDE55376.1 putative aldouronate transport system substrate-binding protein [Paenibacillus sp. cl123]SFW66459.1 putative aldouronate transport system substrate-binding protein [Paenibacillus sp. UNCCL117]